MSEDGPQQIEALQTENKKLRKALIGESLHQSREILVVLWDRAEEYGVHERASYLRGLIDALDALRVYGAEDGYIRREQ